ncbi:MAG TPA: transglutaminase family protein [Thermohalobaculum sp.]|nr:transglutaminase family protein [Thermohalobaculum sp.]
MRLTIRHLTDHEYDPAPNRIALRLKLFPAKTRSQAPSGWQVVVNGQAVEPMLTNGFGDFEALWFAPTGTTQVEMVAEGTVTTSDTAGVIGRLGVAPPELFLRHTPLTRQDADIRSLAEAAVGTDPLARMHALSAAVHDAMVYRPGVTDSGTTAAQALALGAGVCQDKTHLLIAAARAAGIPARYVVGYLHEESAPLGETHAWAEAHLDGLGWVGFDPTHQICPTGSYVRLCSGLDADDAAPVRGSLTGATEDRMTVSVSVAYAQSQQQ